MFRKYGKQWFEDSESLLKQLHGDIPQNNKKKEEDKIKVKSEEEKEEDKQKEENKGKSKELIKTLYYDVKQLKKDKEEL